MNELNFKDKQGSAVATCSRFSRAENEAISSTASVQRSPLKRCSPSVNKTWIEILDELSRNIKFSS